MTRKYKGPEWVRFNEEDESTYPPIGEPVLISYNTGSYGYSPSSVAWASLQIRYNSTYYWYCHYFNDVKKQTNIKSK